MITGIVMASGFSRRFGGNKLLSLYKNQPLFSFSLTAAKNSLLDALVVVSQYSEILSYCENNGIAALHNSCANLGQSQSLLLGVAHSVPGSHLMFLTADQPKITPEIINQLITSSRENPEKIIIPLVGETPATPTIFPPFLRQELLAVSGDQGGRQVIANHLDIVLHVPMEQGHLLFDVDTPEDLSSLG